MDLSARTPITSSSFNSSSDAPLCNGIEHSFSNDDDADDNDNGDNDDDEYDDDEDEDERRRMRQLRSVSAQS